MKIFLAILWTCFVFFLGAIAHEYDIYHALVKYGHSGKAGWIYHIEAPGMKK